MSIQLLECTSIQNSCLPEGFHDFASTVYLQWYINTVCPYHCEYCYVRQTTDRWGYMSRSLDQKAVYDLIERAPYKNIGITLLGGEPTAHPDFWIIVDTLTKMPRVYVDVITNGFQSKEFFYEGLTSLPNRQKEKLRFEFSYHTDTLPCLEKFMRKVNIVHGILPLGASVTVMASKNPHRLKDTQRVYEFISTIGIPVNLTFLIDPLEDQKPLDYDWSSYKFYLQGCPLTHFMKLKENGVERVRALNDIEVYAKRWNAFKGWKCYNNIFCIDIHNSIYRLCDNEHHGMVTSPDYWNFTNEVCTCPNEYCTCTGLLTERKVNNAE